MMKKFKFGLKLWSTNNNYIEEAIKLYKNSTYDYIELYVIPDSYENYIKVWQELNIPFIIHAPHFRDGLNLAEKNKFYKNMELAHEAQHFADKLNANWIIFHPGIDGNIKETASQLKYINDSRILIENKPYYALDNGLICNGTTPEEIEFLIKEVQIGFCLDIGHAICSANAHNIDSSHYIKNFISLKPTMYHLTDGDIQGIYDKHLHIGEGSFDMKFTLSFIQNGSMLTIETLKSSMKNLNDFVGDIRNLKNIYE